MRKKHYDKVFLIIIGVLLLFGLFALASASLGLAARQGLNFYKVILRQIILGLGVGSVLFFITSRVYYKKWQKFALPFFLFAFFISLLVFIKTGVFYLMVVLVLLSFLMLINIRFPKPDVKVGSVAAVLILLVIVFGDYWCNLMPFLLLFSLIVYIIWGFLLFFKK